MRSSDLLSEIGEQQAQARRRTTLQRPAFTDLCKDFLELAGVKTFVLGEPVPGTPAQGRNEGSSSVAGITITEDGQWVSVHPKSYDSEPKEELIPDPLGQFFTPNGESVGCLFYGDLTRARDRLAKQGEGTTTQLRMQPYYHNAASVTVDGVKMEDLNDPLRLASHYLLGVFASSQAAK